MNEILRQKFSSYLTDINTYIDKYPDYLKTPGSIVLNQIQLLYDIFGEFQEQIFDMWQHTSIDFLFSEYLFWKSNPSNTDDNLWKYNDMLEKLCKTFDITREHPVGQLTNRHMLRLLKIKISGVGFDGTKESLNRIVQSLFQNTTITFLGQTDNTKHASANVYVIKNPDDTGFDATDTLLFEGGYYFLELLGITYDFDVINSNSLIYDINDYDNGNKYDEGGE
jgi:hypothetical protein